MEQLPGNGNAKALAAEEETGLPKGLSVVLGALPACGQGRSSEARQELFHPTACLPGVYCKLGSGTGSQCEIWHVHCWLQRIIKKAF